MKPWIRVVQLVLLLLLIGYLFWFHTLNPYTVTLPLFLSMPPALVAFLALILGALIAWIPDQAKLWRLRRENRRLERRLLELEGGSSTIPEPTLTRTDVQKR